MLDNEIICSPSDLPDLASRLCVLAEGIELRAVLGAFHRGDPVEMSGLKTEPVGVFDCMSFGVLRREPGRTAIPARPALSFLD